MVALGARALDDALDGERDVFGESLDGERDVFGESHEEVELLVGRSTHTRSSVHGEHPQRLASPILERDDQCVLGRERIGAATLGGRCQQTGVVATRARVADRAVARSRASAHGRNAEVVPRPPVEGDRDAVVAEQVGDRVGQMTETGLQVAAGSRQTRHLDDAAQGSR